MKNGSTNTSSCPYCGKELKTNTIDLAGRTITVYRELCHCEQAEAERMRELMEEQQRKAADERKRMERAGIPQRFFDSPLKDGWRCGAYLFGSIGVGKTWTAAGMARKALEDGATVRFMAGGAYLDAFKASYNGDYTAFYAMRNCGLLVLDDLGKERPSQWAVESLFKLVDHRYNVKKPVIITSNYPLNRLGMRLTNGDPITAAAIVSRLSEMCPRVEVQGLDRRL